MKLKFDSLQMFRGLAVLGVVFYHTANNINLFVGNMPVWVNWMFSHGFLGVDFFFVLSGFIIMGSHFDDEKSIAALKSYSIKRFIRIFPPYWPVSISLIFAFIVLPSMRHEYHGELSLLSSLLLLPDARPPALAVAWTLIHELIFYMIFCLYFISNRVFLIFVTVWVLAISAVAWFIGEGDFSPFLVRLLSPINLEFVLGMGVAYLAREVSTRSARSWIFFGGTIFALLLLWPFSVECRILFGFPFSAWVLGAVLLERQGRVVFPRQMVILGDASYSIYLTHNQLLSLMFKRFARLHGFTSWWLGMLLGVISCVVIGLLYHMFFEKPLIRIFRKTLTPMRTK